MGLVTIMENRIEASRKETALSRLLILSLFLTVRNRYYKITHSGVASFSL